MEHPLHLFRFCPRCGSNDFTENDFKSKRCGACGFVLYFNPQSATVALIVNKRNELLVARRAKEPAKGTLDLPGGFADCFETGEEGVTREVLEETGLVVTATKYLFSLPNIYVYSGFEEHTLDIFYLCTVQDDTLPAAHDDVEELQWIPIEKLNAREFGLQSIRKGIEIFMKEYLETNRY
ncbi:MAG: NUDIX domain-containing protein [Bacteroidaceae bacterium]|nr:NUDIX domain-containing protein [Bacteroidaceae bacterium]